MDSGTNKHQPSTFCKQERIVSQKLIGELFTSRQNRVLTAYPLRAIHIEKERAREDAPALQLLISVPKRQFKHAVDRNRVKRQIREAYRRQKALLAAALDEHCQLALAFVWLSPQYCPTEEVYRRVGTLLRRIKEGVRKKDTPPCLPQREEMKKEEVVRRNEEGGVS